MERWLPVREFPDHYEISSLGNLRRIGSDQIRKPQVARNGYPMFMICIKNQRCMRSAHRMVADAFLGPIPSGMQVNHKNGVKGDPRVENLEIVSNGENRAHAYRVLGVKPNRGAIGLKNVHAKLTWDEVREMREKYAAGSESYRTLARAYKTTTTTISRIVKMKVRREA
jgi:hypothetical protein